MAQIKIKQIKSRNAKYLYDKDNVLLCRIIKDSNFLRFEFLGEALEIDHLESPDPMSKEKLVEFIKREYPKGRSARSIAGSSGYSHTTVNRVISDLIREGDLKERGSGNLPNVTEFLKVTEVSTVSTSQKMETTAQVENMKCLSMTDFLQRKKVRGSLSYQMSVESGPCVII